MHALEAIDAIEDSIVTSVVARRLRGPVLELLRYVEARGSSIQTLLCHALQLARDERQKFLEARASRLLATRVAQWFGARKRKRAARILPQPCDIHKWRAVYKALDEPIANGSHAVSLSTLSSLISSAPITRSHTSFAIENLSTNFDETECLRSAAEKAREVDEDAQPCSQEDIYRSPQAAEKKRDTILSKSQDALWTKHALDWMKHADPRWRAILAQRVGRLLEGDRTYATAKLLQGMKRRKLYEAKLDSGMRVLWEERKKSVIIWFIAKHDAVPRLARLVDTSDERRVETLHCEAVDVADEGPLIDPLSHSLLPSYCVRNEDLDRLASGSSWVPPLALSTEERALVDSSVHSAVLLLGRSGTGKTVCTAMRMLRDARHATRRVFVARSRGLCEHVRGLLRASVIESDVTDGRMQDSAECLDLDAFVDRLAALVRPDELHKFAAWRSRPCARRVSFSLFRNNLTPSRGDSTTTSRQQDNVEPLTAWTQIRCFIKASAEAVVLGRRLHGDEFATNDAFNCRSRLDSAMRREVLRICDRYDAFLKDHGHIYWDESDRIRDVASAALYCGWDSHTPPFDRVYIDEVQDLTQAHVILALLAVGADPSRLWLSGDTAQSIAYGAHFRFADVRSAIHAVVTRIANATKLAAPKVVKLSKNFRTHSGVLNLANSVMASLHASFPDSAVDKLPREVACANESRLSALYSRMSRLHKKRSLQQACLRPTPCLCGQSFRSCCLRNACSGRAIYCPDAR